MIKSFMVFATVAIIGGVVASVAQAGALMTTTALRAQGGADHGFNSGLTLPVGHNYLPGVNEDVNGNPDPDGTTHPDYGGDYYVFTGGNGNPTRGVDRDAEGMFGRGIDRILNRQPTNWPSRDGVGSTSGAWASDFISLGSEAGDSDKGIEDGSTFLNWRPGGEWTFLDFDVRSDGRFRGEHRGGPEDGVPPFPEWTDKTQAGYTGADSNTWEFKMRINSATPAGYTHVMGFYNMSKDSYWSQVFYNGRPGQLDEFFIDGEMNAGSQASKGAPGH